MNIKETESLLDKYYAGETSLEEEQKLKEFFCKENLPGHLLKHQALFTYYTASSQERMLKNVSTAGFIARPKRFYYLSGIAAGLLLLCGLYFTFQHDIFKKQVLHQPNLENEAAFNQASEALLMVSSNLNTGLDQIHRLEAFDKAMKNARKLDKFYQCQTLIINPDGE